MKNKLLSVDIFSYFIRVIFLLIIGIIIFLFATNLYSLCNLLFSSFEKRLCIYKSILESNNIVSDFLFNHYYNIFQSKSYLFLDDSDSILNISVFLRSFEIFKYLYFLIIGLISFRLINNYSKNNVYKNNVNNNLLYISIMLILLPFIYLIRDYIGCTLINKLPIKEPIITYEPFKIFYLLIGFISLSIYLLNKYHIKNKDTSKLFIIFRLVNVLFLMYFAYSVLVNINNLINVIKLNKDTLTYHELAKIQHPFIVVLVNNGFEIFGKSWTYLGLNTNLELPMILYYSFKILFNFLITYILAVNLNNLVKGFNDKLCSNKIKLTLNLSISFLIMFILEMVIMLVVISIYKNYEYYNKNLEYGIFNFEYLYYLPLSLIIFTSSLTLKEMKKK